MREFVVIVGFSICAAVGILLLVAWVGMLVSAPLALALLAILLLVVPMVTAKWVWQLADPKG